MKRRDFMFEALIGAAALARPSSFFDLTMAAGGCGIQEQLLPAQLSFPDLAQIRGSAASATSGEV